MIPSPAHPVRDAVLSMPMARTLGLAFDHIGPGEVTLRMPVRDSLCHRPGQLQAAAVFAVADFAGVAAAGTLLAPGWLNATVDGTIKLMAPARGSHLLARGRVLQAGQLLSVCAAEVYAVEEGRETLCATWLGTARNLAPRPAA